MCLPISTGSRLPFGHRTTRQSLGTLGALLRRRGPDTIARMCRNIRVLLNFEPPTTDDEVRAAALQYVRKVTGTRAPSQSNRALFERSIDEIAHITRHLVDAMEVHAPPRTREAELARARARNLKRFGPKPS